MQIIQPVDASLLPHPLADFYRETCTPCAGLAKLHVEMKTPLDYLAATWRPELGEIDTDMPMPLSCGTCWRQDDTGPKDLAALNGTIAKAWDPCAAHFPLASLVETDWLVCLSRDICLFLPWNRIDGPRPYPESGQNRLERNWAQKRENPSLFLPFIPILIGRGSRHEDVASHKRASRQIRAILTQKLPGPVDIREPR